MDYKYNTDKLLKNNFLLDYINMTDEEITAIEFENTSMTNIVETTINKIRTETMKDSTIKVYRRQLGKLYNALKDSELDFKFYKECPQILLYNPKLFLDWIKDKPYGVKLSDRTLKNYLSLVLSIVRNYRQENKEFELAYNTIFYFFNTLKNSLNAEQEKQEPKEKEEDLKELDMTKLKSYMNYWERKTRGKDNKDCYSAFMYAMGHIHLDQVLRNELCDMIITKDWLPMCEEDKNVNFIWDKGRNKKLLVIRSNKVRNPDRGDKPKEVWLEGKVNTAINKYIQVLGRNDITLDNPIPFCWSIKDKNCCKMSSSNYSQLFRKLFEHKGYPISTTDLRKVYAMTVRKEHGGNLLKEKEACLKLDHSKDTHDKHYILDFT